MFMHIYIYIYIYWQNFAKYKRYFLSTYFLVDPFLMPYWFYSIWWELIDIFSIIVYFPSTFNMTRKYLVRKCLLNSTKFVYIYIYIYIFVAYFSINGRFCLVSLKNPTFSNIFPRANHVLMTFEFWTLCACLSIFSLYISHWLLSSQQSPIDIVNYFISKSWWWLLKAKR